MVKPETESTETGAVETPVAGAVATRSRPFGDSELSEITSFDDALAMLANAGIIPEQSEDYGNGFKLCENKGILVGVPFLIAQWSEHMGDYGMFVSAYIVTEDGRKLVLVDGSTGIRDQLREVERKRMQRDYQGPTNSALLVRGGLVQSDYTYVDAEGAKRPATTFYLAQ